MLIHYTRQCLEDLLEEVSSTTQVVNKEKIDSGSLLSGEIEIEGVQYTLPEDIHRFMNNGWSVSGIYYGQNYYTNLDINEHTLSDRKTAYITLVKNGKEIEVEMPNYTGKELSLAECKIKQINFHGEIDMTIAGKITFDVTVKKLLAMGFEESELFKGMYTIYGNDSSDNIQVFFTDFNQTSDENSSIFISKDRYR